MKFLSLLTCFVLGCCFAVNSSADINVSPNSVAYYKPIPELGFDIDFRITASGLTVTEVENIYNNGGRVEVELYRLNAFFDQNGFMVPQSMGNAIMNQTEALRIVGGISSLPGQQRIIGEPVPNSLWSPAILNLWHNNAGDMTSPAWGGQLRIMENGVYRVPSPEIIEIQEMLILPSNGGGSGGTGGSGG